MAVLALVALAAQATIHLKNKDRIPEAIYARSFVAVGTTSDVKAWLGVYELRDTGVEIAELQLNSRDGPSVGATASPAGAEIRIMQYFNSKDDPGTLAMGVWSKPFFYMGMGEIPLDTDATYDEVLEHVWSGKKIELEFSETGLDPLLRLTGESEVHEIGAN